MTNNICTNVDLDTSSAAYHIAINKEFLIEEINPKPLIEYLSKTLLDVQKSREIQELRRRYPFNRKEQVLAILEALSKETWTYLNLCMVVSHQPMHVISKLQNFEGIAESPLPITVSYVLL